MVLLSAVSSFPREYCLSFCWAIYSKEEIVKRAVQLDLETAIFPTRWQYAFQLGYSHNEWKGWKFQPFIHSFCLLPCQLMMDIQIMITENYLSRCMNDYVSIFITTLFERLNLDELVWIFLLHSLMFIAFGIFVSRIHKCCIHVSRCQY